MGGAGLARGYFHHPELTAERFLPDPISGIQGSRMYKTGDLAGYLPDGNIRYFGRIDHQVKIRGFRIELGEIQAVLSEHPDIKESVVIVREDSPGDKRLVAYVVPVKASWSDVRTLRKHLKGRLPEYMVPVHFVALGRLPLTPNGKLDRRSLPPPARTRSDAESSYVAPRFFTEERLAAIWKDVLKVDRVGVLDNFFELGGQSLLATQVVSRIGEFLNVDLPVRELFQNPTIAELAQKVDAIQWVNRSRQDSSDRTADREEGVL
jgi:acyl carrier protein